jgi:hypothetical protein
MIIEIQTVDYKTDKNEKKLKKGLINESYGNKPMNEYMNE